MLQPATFEDFMRQTGKGNVVPIVRTLPADLLTPVGAFMRVAADEDFAFLLESVEGGATVARYTFLGARPEMIVRGRGRQTLVERDGKSETHDATVTDFLRTHFASRRLAAREGLPPLAGGAIGYLGYEAAALFEPLLEKLLHDNAHHAASHKDAYNDDLAVWMFFRDVLAFDHVQQLLHITSIVTFGESETDEAALRARYTEAVNATERIARRLLGTLESPATHHPVNLSTSTSSSPVVFKSAWTRSEFESAVETIKESIWRGDCYQAVLSQRFTAKISAAPVEIYRALRRTNPAPYMYFLRLNTTSIVGASPEMLVRVRGRTLEYRPIAGTRPRGFDEAEDGRLAEEMRRDAKECAEHTMLVDLGRNDLGRVARAGTVRVETLMSVEKYAHVQHLVSSLRAELDARYDRFDALAACFPAGTVTGAPKLRAMEIINELEPHKRGVYAGAICYLDYAGNLDSCIAIRTLVVEAHTAHVQAGAGIVADSVAHLEYEETINKARAIIRAVSLVDNG
ncbi:MAG: anthranilate synthase component I family protein [Pyrinomonadaceae bacterium MAG19_C2-C3]|nr:anthranilate synthase component I family protein [Pyrinomonadaceae bacterium MAG19_C2-C3]